MKYCIFLLIVNLLTLQHSAKGWNTPVLNTPANGASVWTGVTFDWYAVSGSQKYHLQLDTVADFSSPVMFSVIKNYINSSSGNSDTEHYMNHLYFGQTYFWRVRA